jgi:hypothetical protein
MITPVSTVLAALSKSGGIVVRDDCSYHKKKDHGAYRTQCPSAHLHWYPDSATFYSLNFSGGETKRDSVYSRVLSIEKEIINGVPTNVCFIESVPPSFDCPPCVPVLGTMIWTFDSSKNEYLLHSVKLNVASIGQNGLIVSPPEKLALKKDRNGYMFTQSTFFQGISETEFVLMGVVENEFRALLKVITESDNEGACEDPVGCWSYTSQITTKENNEQPFDDIILSTAGTRMTEDGKSEFKKKSVYRFNGVTYKLLPRSR